MSAFGCSTALSSTGVRVVIAPDKFAGTLTAVEAARAIAAGWHRRAPGDMLSLVPMSDGGPGFVDVLHSALGGELRMVTVAGPYGDPTPLTLLIVDDVAYIESAQAVGLHLTTPDRRRPEAATTVGVGEAIRAAVDGGARQIVVGLGGSGTNDGGAGLLAALGATAVGGDLSCGPAGLASLESVDVAPARELLAGVDLVLATDVENPLLGIVGATKTFGPQKGLAEERLVAVDGWLQRLASLADRKLADAKGAGAAGGLGYALLLLGGVRTPGVDVVADAIGLRSVLASADLVITGEGEFDVTSRAGKVPYGVAALAADALVPCVVLAGRVSIGAREMRAIGVESAYALVDLVGEQRALGEPAGALADLAERIARTWSRE